MVLEANKQEARRCVEIARDLLANSKNHSKARKFLNKAVRLDPSVEDLANDLLRHASTNGSCGGGGENDEEGCSGYADFDQYTEEGLRNRQRHKGPPSFDDETNGPSSSSVPPSQQNKATDRGRQDEKGEADDVAARHRLPSLSRATSTPQLGVDYTQEEIRKSKDYYEILNLNKDADDALLKKNYRKLALQFHPDKCHAPGATEAFKAINNAYAVISNKEKRERYDMFGSDEQQRHRRRPNSAFYEYDYSRGFEAEFTPEEIFNMFFGGGYPSGQMNRRRANFHYYHSADNGDVNNYGGFGALLQLLPILLLLLLSLASQLLIGDPSYSLQRTNKYMNERRTNDLKVAYYVKDDFEKHYGNQLGKVEQQVEDDYIQNLRMACYRERAQKENLAWRARTFGDSDLWRRAQSMATPSCDRLQQVYA